MARFILIDHSIKGWGGHYLEYAHSVLEAAREAGYQPFLVTNRAFREHLRNSSLPFPVLPVYRFDVWGRGESRPFPRPSAFWNSLRRRLPQRFRERMSFTLLHLLAEGAGDPQRLLVSPLLRRHPLGSSLVKLASGLKKTERKGKPKPENPAPPPKAESTTFREDSRILFQRHLTLEKGDLVFIPTLSEADLEGLKDYLLQDPESMKASWHLVFRRNLFTGWEVEYPSLLRQVESVRQTLEEMRHRLPHHRIFLYTDTERLTRQYESLGAGKFHTLPIPVDRRLKPERRPSENGRPLRITYLGDARLEKGFSYLPDLILDLWDDYVATGRAEFVIQCNFAFHPREQPGVVVALSQLEPLEDRGIKLIREPLDQERYLELLLSADINLLLYDQERYYARSSGILVESLSAGIPVLVTGGTWLAEQLEEAHRQHHREIMLQAERELLLTGETKGTVEIPEGEKDCLLFSFLLSRHLERDFPLWLQVRQKNRYGLLLGSQTFVFHALGADGERSALLRMLPETARVEFTLSSPHPVRLLDSRVYALKSRDGKILPLGAVGLVAGRPEEASALLKELIIHYPHYRRTAEEFSTPWRERHNARRLVSELARNAAFQPAESEARTAGVSLL